MAGSLASGFRHALCWPKRATTCTFEGTLNVDGREIPIEAIVKALHEQFLAKRTNALIQKITDQVVRTATRRVIDDEDAEKDQA